MHTPGWGVFMPEQKNKNLKSRSQTSDKKKASGLSFSDMSYDEDRQGFQTWDEALEKSDKDERGRPGRELNKDRDSRELSREYYTPPDKKSGSD